MFGMNGMDQPLVALHLSLSPCLSLSLSLPCSLCLRGYCRVMIWHVSIPLWVIFGHTRLDFERMSLCSVTQQAALRRLWVDSDRSKYTVAPGRDAQDTLQRDIPVVDRIFC